MFDPLDLAIIDRVYDAAWAQLEAREPFRQSAGGHAPVIARVHDVQKFVVHARGSTDSL